MDMKELARLAGIDYHYLRQINKCKRSLTQRVCYKLSPLLGVRLTPNTIKPKKQPCKRWEKTIRDVLDVNRCYYLKGNTRTFNNAVGKWRHEAIVNHTNKSLTFKERGVTILFRSDVSNYNKEMVL